jgi:hypothetical protein
MWNVRNSFILLSLIALVAAGCAKPPETEQSAAMAAMQQATQSEAEFYAPEALQKAKAAQAAFEEEMRLQEEKFALTRNYDNAKSLAQEAEAAARTAAQQAGERKQEMRQEMQGEIEATQALLQEVQGMLSSAPTGKGSTMDLQVMSSDLTAAGATLDEAQTLFAGDQLQEAAAKLQAAQSTIESVKTSIEQARQMKAGARKSS